MAVSIRTFVAGPIQTNAYLVTDDETKLALVIDAPPDFAGDLLDALNQGGLTLSLIVLTHHHWDHIVDASALRAATGAPIAAHPASVPFLEEPSQPRMPLPFQVPPVTPDRMLNDGDRVPLGTSAEFQVIHTPGHAPGQISLYEPALAVLFGGDTLFAQGYGRVDLPGASVEQTVRSLTRLMELPDDVTVYSGHGPSTTIGAERPWISALKQR